MRLDSISPATREKSSESFTLDFEREREIVLLNGDRFEFHFHHTIPPRAPTETSTAITIPAIAPPPIPPSSPEAEGHWGAHDPSEHCVSEEILCCGTEIEPTWLQETD